MGRQNGTIVIPINTDDVSATLGHASHDVGTLCLSEKINKWSLHKPVKHTSLAELTEAQFQSVDYGLKPLNIGNANPGIMLNLINSINTNKGVDWEYVRPTGGDYPYRLTDFIGYIHSRQPWFNLQLGVEEGAYAFVSKGHSIQIQQENDIDIGWLQNNLATFKALSSTLCCNGVIIYSEGMTASNDWHVFCAFRTLKNLNGRSNFEVGIPSNFPSGKYLVVPVIAVFGSGSMPDKLANLTDSSSGAFNYVFFQGDSDSTTINPPTYKFSRISSIYPLPCVPGKIQVFDPNESPTNPSNYFTANLQTTAGTYGITTTSTTYNGSKAWMVKFWGKVSVSMIPNAPSGLAGAVGVTLKLPNCTAQGGFGKDSSNRPYKSVSVSSGTPAVISTTSSSPITFYLVEGSFDANSFGWYETDSNGNQTFRCASIPYILQAATGTVVNRSFSILD